MESSSLKKVTTLEGMSEITSKRRDGNSTRLVDNAIQILFNGNICVVLDHYEMGRNRQANRCLFDAILRRLESDHRHILNERRVKIDKNRLEIMIVEEPMLDKLELGTGVTLNKI